MGFLVNYGRAFGVLGHFMEESRPIGPECSPFHGRKKYAYETWLGLDCPPRPCFRSVFPRSVNRKQHGQSLAPLGVTEESHRPGAMGRPWPLQKGHQNLPPQVPPCWGSVLCHLSSPFSSAALRPALACFSSLLITQRALLLSKFSISPCPPPTFFSTPLLWGMNILFSLGRCHSDRGTLRKRNAHQSPCNPRR